MAGSLAHADVTSIAQTDDYSSRRDGIAAALRQSEQTYLNLVASLGARHPDTLDSLDRLIEAHLEARQIQAALPLARQRAELRVEILGEDHPDALESLSRLASLLGVLGQHAEQAEINQKVFTLRSKVLGSKHRATMSSMLNLALSYAMLGRHDDSLAITERLLPLMIETLGERDPATLSAMNNRADTLLRAGRPREALALNERVLALRTEVLGDRHPRTLTSMGNLAYTYSVLGRHTEALGLNEQVLRLRTEILGERHPDTLFVMNNLGQTYYELGRYADALTVTERAYRLRIEVLGPRHPDTITGLNELGRLQSALRHYAEAAELFERSVALHRDVLGERHPNTLAPMTSLARVDRALGLDAKALVLAETVLRLQVETLGERHPRALNSLAILARTYDEMGRHALAREMAEKAVRLQTETLGERHPDTLISLDILMQIESAAGRGPEALELAEKVLSLRTAVLGPQHPATLSSVSSLAWQFESNGRRRDAVALAERYVAGAESQRGQAGLSANDRRGIFEAYAQGYRRFSIDSGLVGEIDLGFRLAELGKGRTLLESMTSQRAGRSGVLPATEQAALEELNRQVAAQDQLIAQARSAEARVDAEAAHHALVRQYDVLQARLRASYPKYAQLSAPNLIDARHLHDLVPADAIALSFIVLADDRVAVWLLDSTGRPRFVDLGRVPQLTKAVEIVRSASARARGLPEALDDADLRAWRLPDGSYELLGRDRTPPAGAEAVVDESEVVEWLSAKLLHPFQEALRGKAKWIVAPDGPLGQLPFELLRVGGRRVLEAADIHYTQSLSLYSLSRALQRQYRSLSRPMDMLALGNPIYDDALPADRRLARSAVVTSEEDLRSTRLAWPALPGTAVEVEAIRRLLPRTRTLLSAQASEAQLQQLNQSGELRDYRMLHFAVHGNLSTRDPALSSLVLSQKDLAPGTDGYVTAAEWPGYDLRSDLTVLSACETGLGRNVSGEGVMGLPFALFLAGNVNTVLSLWPVLDSVTPLFMQKFYARIKAGKSASRALTETKREMASDPRTRLPVNWAAFILVGAG